MVMACGLALIAMNQIEVTREIKKRKKPGSIKEIMEFEAQIDEERAAAQWHAERGGGGVVGWFFGLRPGRRFLDHNPPREFWARKWMDTEPNRTTKTDALGGFAQ